MRRQSRPARRNRLFLKAALFIVVSAILPSRARAEVSPTLRLGTHCKHSSTHSIVGIFNCFQLIWAVNTYQRSHQPER